MANITTKSELLTEGLASYPDAKKAVKAFEDYIGEIATGAMKDHLGKYRVVTGQPDFNETWITTGYFKSYDGGDRLEVQAGCPQPVYYIGWGIQWKRGENKPATLSAYITAGCGGSKKRQDTLFRKLAGQSTADDIKLAKAPAEWGVDMSKEIAPTATEEEIKEALCAVIANFLDSVAKIGGIQAAIMEE